MLPTKLTYSVDQYGNEVSVSGNFDKKLQGHKSEQEISNENEKRQSFGWTTNLVKPLIYEENALRYSKVHFTATRFKKNDSFQIRATAQIKWGSVSFSQLAKGKCKEISK
jgi:hypothetical protein